MKLNITDFIVAVVALILTKDVEFSRLCYAAYHMKVF